MQLVVIVLKKKQFILTLVVFFILLLTILPKVMSGFLSTITSHSVSFMIIHTISELFVLYVISVVIKNYIIGVIFRISSSELKFDFKVDNLSKGPVDFFYNKIGFSLILPILIIYGIVYLVFPVELLIPCKSIFIFVYYISGNLIDDKIYFIGEKCFVFNKATQRLHVIYSFKSNESKYKLFLEKNNTYPYEIIVDNSVLDLLNNRLRQLGIPEAD